MIYTLLCNISLFIKNTQYYVFDLLFSIEEDSIRNVQF